MMNKCQVLLYSFGEDVVKCLPYFLFSNYKVEENSTN